MDINYYKQFEPIDGKWHITKELGSGSFGTVFEIVREDYPDMKAALKVVSIPASQKEVETFARENYDLDEQSVTSYFYGFVEEFVKEFRLMSQLKGHSNIVSYEDHDVIKRTDSIGWDIFIRMELLNTMNEYFAGKPLETEDVVRLGIDICKALETCKKHNIIHRDIKPSNIFVSPNGDFKLGDFGVARTLEKTSSGLSKKGTYTYMAPEVFKGTEYGLNVDIYSLGIVMYKLLNNNLEPFRTDRTHTDGERALEKRMQGADMPKPANADGRLAEIILKACSYNPAMRYSDPAQMREDLESLMNGSAPVEMVEETQNTVGMFGSPATGFGSVSNTPVQPVQNPNYAPVPPVQTPNYAPVQQEIKPVAFAEPVNNEKPAKSGSKKPLLIAVIALVAVLVLGTAGFFGFKYFKKENQAATAPALVDLGEHYTYELYPREAEDISELDDIAKTVKSRLDVLGLQSNAIVEGEKIILQVPKAFATTDAAEEKILELVTQSGSLTLTSYYSVVAENCNETIESIAVKTEKRKDFMKSMKGTISDDLYDELDDLAGDNISYLHVKFNDEGAENFQKCLDEKDTGKMLALIDYRNLGEAGGYNTEYAELGEMLEVSGAGSKEMYIVPSMVADVPNIGEFIKNILENDLMGSGFAYVCTDEPSWETDEAVMGEYQVAELDGNYVVVEYQDDYDTDLVSAEEYSKSIETIKERLDMFEVPYAFGYRGVEQRTFAFKMSPEHIGSDMLRMITGRGNVEFRSQFSSTYMYQRSIEIIDEGGNKAFKVSFGNPDYNTKTDVFNDYNRLYGDTEDPNLTSLPEDSMIYMVINSVTVSSADMSALADDLTLTFRDLQFMGKKTIDSSDEKFMNFVQCIIEEDYDDMGASWKDIKVTYYEGGKATNYEYEQIPWKYNNVSETDKAVKAVVERHGYKMHKAYSDRNSLIVEMNIPLGDDYISQFVEKLKEIYTECNFDDGSYQTITFCADYGEDRNPYDKAEFVFTKQATGMAVWYKSFTGPTYGDYWSQAYEAEKTDEFLVARKYQY